jgi:hypothetical protein
MEPFQKTKSVFYARTAQNFYNMNKGYYRPRKGKSTKRGQQGSLQRSLNMMAAYGDYDSLMKYIPNRT